MHLILRFIKFQIYFGSFLLLLLLLETFVYHMKGHLQLQFIGIIHLFNLCQILSKGLCIFVYLLVDSCYLFAFDFFFILFWHYSLGNLMDPKFIFPPGLTCSHTYTHQIELARISNMLSNTTVHLLKRRGGWNWIVLVTGSIYLLLFFINGKYEPWIHWKADLFISSSFNSLPFKMRCIS